MNIRPIRKTGDSRQGTLKATYDEIVAALGFEPNATDLDDPHKVSASWGFEGPALPFRGRQYHLSFVQKHHRYGIIDS